MPKGNHPRLSQGELDIVAFDPFGDAEVAPAQRDHAFAAHIAFEDGGGQLRVGLQPVARSFAHQ